MLAFYSNYYDVKAMRAPRVPVEEQYRLIMECRKSGLSDHQEVVKIEMNSISVPTDINKNTDTAAMELMIGNMNLRISDKTDPLLLAKTIQILTELSCSTADAMEENIEFVKAAVPAGRIQEDTSLMRFQKLKCSKTLASCKDDASVN